MGRMGLRSRLTVLVLLAVVPLFGFVLADAATARDQARTDAADQVQRLAHSVGAAEDQVVDHVRDLTIALSVLPDIRSLRPERCAPILAALMPKYPDIVNLGLTDPTGLVLCSAAPLSGPVSLGDRSYIRRAVETRSIAFGEYEVGRITAQPLLAVALPILGSAGEVQGVVVAARLHACSGSRTPLQSSRRGDTR
jgi:hypothetical protein